MQPTPELVLLCVCVCVFQGVVQRAVLSRRIPQAQAFLRRRGSVECSLEDIRKTGLRHTFTCLTHRDLEQAKTLLTNMVHTHTAGILYCSQVWGLERLFNV